ncbi:hypothetical protein, partial [Falsiroseomonas oryzae]|uniref:hypothetical protein n=1 Tax=Falsiroseomonas oryzae TaxID=2766473 RepID=UPI0022EAB281
MLLAAGFGADLLVPVAGAAHAPVTLLLTGLVLAGGVATGAYDHPILFDGARQLRRIGLAALAAIAVALAAATAFDAAGRIDAAWLVMATAFGAAGLAAGRYGTAALLRGAPRS